MMKHTITALFFFAAASEVNADGSASCPCLAAPAGTQTAATDKPDFVTGTTYGYGCKLHDDPSTYSQPNAATVANLCIAALAGTDTTVDGEADDWCADQWCIVDKDNCDTQTRPVTYSEATGDYFSYETCEGDGFAGNGWVGRLQCTHDENSFCWDAADAASYTFGGSASCLCLAPPADTQTAATGKPDFVTGTTYGYGCKNHDDPSTYSQPDAATFANLCIAALAGTDTTVDGEADDWCADQWCIVDKDSCDTRTRPVTYSADTGDYFSYETCEGDGFAGNGWVGREICTYDDESFCAADAATWNAPDATTTTTTTESLSANAATSMGASLLLTVAMLMVSLIN
jgi:hypothetical protein